ncbi:MAG: hypothetical protein GY749_35245 [Desulfobacteraceae bacterium]|nr:hypothetical protein [Desulfobacteraceae bacterium]
MKMTVLTLAMVLLSVAVWADIPVLTEEKSELAQSWETKKSELTATPFPEPRMTTGWIAFSGPDQRQPNQNWLPNIGDCQHFGFVRSS